MDEYTYETICTSDERFRAQVHLELDSGFMVPDGDYFGTVLQLERGRFNVFAQSYDAKRSNDAWDDVLDALWGDFANWEQIEAVLRGRLSSCEDCYTLLDGLSSTSECEEAEDGYHTACYNFSENPVVGFDIVDRGYGAFVNIVTLRDLRTWGFDSLEDYQNRNPNHDPSFGNLDEFEAWADGEVYYVTVEEAVTEVTQIFSVLGQPTSNPLRTATRTAWEEIDEHTCHGFYGTAGAIEYAQWVIDQIEKEEVA